MGRRKYLREKEQPDFRARNREYGRKWRERNRDKANAKALARYHQARRACIQAYGGACACCGETQYEFLAIDHIAGGHHRHGGTRATIRLVGAKLARRLYQEKFPSGFRVLCHNCNSAFGFYGYCPHNPAAARPETPASPQLSFYDSQEPLPMVGSRP